MRATHVLAAAIFCISSNVAMADIRTFQVKYPRIIKVQIYKGNATCGSIDNAKLYGPPEDGPMDNRFDKTWSGTGTNGAKICWRRSDPPDAVDGGYTTWQQCNADGDCEIN